MGKYWICICLAWGLGIGGCTPVQQYRYTEGKIYGTFIIYPMLLTRI